MIRGGCAALWLGAAACGPWQRVGSERAPDPAAVVPRLFDKAGLYQEMGLFATREQPAFVASVRFLAGRTADSTIGIVGVSLANNTLSFRRAGNVFEARYRVDVSFRDEGRIVGQSSSDETVRVGAFQETLRADESVIFQRFVTLPPGSLTTTVAIRDRHGAAFSRAERIVAVPRLGDAPAVSSLVPVYRATPRAALDSLPNLVVNPRATAPYGTDTLIFYLERYGRAPSANVIARALSGTTDQEVWRDTVMLEDPGDLAAGIVRVQPESLPVGELVFEAFLEGAADTNRTLALVSFSDEWAVANFDETLSLLRYFGHESVRRELRDAQPKERPELWRTFWEASDPNPLTPENEALNAYFRRLLEANERFREPGEPGWLTERGEVFITLGEPDEIYDSSSDLQDRGLRVIRWVYISHRLSLNFVDETGFGRFRLTPSSRQEYLLVLNRVRRSA